MGIYTRILIAPSETIELKIISEWHDKFFRIFKKHFPKYVDGICFEPVIKNHITECSSIAKEIFKDCEMIICLAPMLSFYDKGYERGDFSLIKQMIDAVKCITFPWSVYYSDDSFSYIYEWGEEIEHLYEYYIENGNEPYLEKIKCNE